MTGSAKSGIGVQARGSFPDFTSFNPGCNRSFRPHCRAWPGNPNGPADGRRVGMGHRVKPGGDEREDL